MKKIKLNHFKYNFKNKIEIEKNFKAIIENIIKDDKTPTGDVVGIIKRTPRKFCGHLEILN